MPFLLNTFICSINFTIFSALNDELYEDVTSNRDTWATNRQGVGAWFNVTFNTSSILTYARIMQRPFQDHSFKSITLDFSDGSSMMVRNSPPPKTSVVPMRTNSISIEKRLHSSHN